MVLNSINYKQLIDLCPLASLTFIMSNLGYIDEKLLSLIYNVFFLVYLRNSIIIKSICGTYLVTETYYFVTMYSNVSVNHNIVQSTGRYGTLRLEMND